MGQVAGLQDDRETGTTKKAATESSVSYSNKGFQRKLKPAHRKPMSKEVG
jgi:hypothetical protein